MTLTHGRLFSCGYGILYGEGNCGYRNDDLTCNYTGCIRKAIDRKTCMERKQIIILPKKRMSLFDRCFFPLIKQLDSGKISRGMFCILWKQVQEENK